MQQHGEEVSVETSVTGVTVTSMPALEEHMSRDEDTCNNNNNKHQDMSQNNQKSELEEQKPTSIIVRSVGERQGWCDSSWDTNARAVSLVPLQRGQEGANNSENECQRASYDDDSESEDDYDIPLLVSRAETGSSSGSTDDDTIGSFECCFMANDDDDYEEDMEAMIGQHMDNIARCASC